MQNVWASAIALHSFGPQHWTTCGRHCSAAGWCSQCVGSWYMAVTAFDITVCIICIVMWFEVQKQGCVTVSRGNITSLEDACDLQLFTWDVVGCQLHCVCPWFPVDTNWMVTPCLVTHHSVSQVHIFITVLLQVFQWFDVWCFLCLLSWVGLGAAQMTPCDIQDPVWWQAQCFLIWRTIDKARIVQCSSLVQCFLDYWQCEAVRVLVHLSFTSCPLRTFRASSQLSSLVHKWHHAFGYQCKQFDILPFQETEWSSSGHVWVDSQTGTASLSSAALCSYSPSQLHSAHFCVCHRIYWVRQHLCHLHCHSNTLNGFSCALYVDYPLPE